MIKVLHVLSNISIRSGVARVLLNYLKVINTNYIKSSIIYYDEVNGDNYKEELNTLCVDYHFFSRKTFRDNLNVFCKDNYGSFDIIQIHEPFLSLMFVDIKKKLGVKKIIFYSHSVKTSDTRIKEIRNRALSLPSRFLADSYFACSRDAGRKVFGKSFEKKGFIIYNAIEINKYKFNKTAREEIRKKYNIRNKFVIGHIGNMTPPKNHFFIIEVFNAYHKINNNSVLMLIGDGYLKDRIKQKIHSLNLENDVLFLGLVNDVYTYLNSMDAFLFPSLFEGLGIALVEAQTNGLKCVFSNSIPEEANLYPKANCVLSLKDAPEKWADALQQIAARNEEITKNVDFDINEAGKRLEIIYNEILGKNNEEK